MSKSQRFEFEEGGSSKFWEIEINDCDVTTKWGRIGTDGQSKTKTFPSEAAAQKEQDKLVREKTSKGYRSTGSSVVSASAPAPAANSQSKEAPGQVATTLPVSIVGRQSDTAKAIPAGPSPAHSNAAVKPWSINLVSVSESPFAKDSKASNWEQRCEELGCRRAGYFVDQASGISVAGFQKPPNVLIAVIERAGLAWAEVVSFYSDKRCDAWSNFPGKETKYDWLEMDHDPQADLQTLVVSSSNASASGKRDIVPPSQFAQYFGEYLTRKGLPTPSDKSASSNSALTTSEKTVQTFEDQVMAFAEEYFKPFNRNANAPIDSVPTGKALLALTPTELVQVMVAAFKLTRRVINRTGYDVLFSLRQNLLKKKLPLTDEVVDYLAEELQKEFRERKGIDVPILTNIERVAKARPLGEKAKTILRFVRDNAADSWLVEKQAPLQARIDALLGETGQRLPLIEEGTEWTRVFIAQLEAMDPERRRAWVELLAHCVQATSAKATANWRKAAAPLLKQVGNDEFHETVSSWPPLLTKVIEVTDAGVAFMGGNQDILRGLIWCCAIKPNDRTLVCLRQIGVAAFKALIALGPRTRVGNACVQVLGEIGTADAVAQLAVLKAKVKNGSAQRGIAKQLEETALRLGLTSTELEEISVPTLGMEEVGVRTESLGDFSARLDVTPHGATLNWFRSDGKPQKSVPTEVKSNFADDLKDLKDATKDIDSILSAQRYRLESLYCIPHEWSVATWRERYLDHPLVGVIARKLIWQFVEAESESSAFWHNGQLLTSENRPLHPTEQARVTLWHPLNQPAETVQAWRSWLVDNEVEQPFKQAHREIYRLTDAERVTGTYSNRFAAHFLRQAQYRTLAQTRRWKVNFMGGFDGGDIGIARKEFPYQDFAVEFWLNAAGEPDPAGYGYPYGSSDNVRFYHPAVNQQAVQLESVPPMIFSEAMRDVDLFVAVCSIGNDPNWIDGGNRVAAFDNYWRNQFQEELIESAKMRRAVLEQIIPRLKIASQCELLERELLVRGKLRTYRIHIGSGNILMEPNNQYLCIVEDRTFRSTSSIQLPFAGDKILSVILSKAFLLADDDKISDKTILAQLRS